MMTKISTAMLKSLSVDELKKLAREKKTQGAAAVGKIIKKNTDPARKYFPITRAQKSMC
jgi:hypothetical protein